MTEDYKRSVDIGTYTIWHSLYSTIMGRIKDGKELSPVTLEFLKNGCCESHYAKDISEEIQYLRDRLATIPPNEAIYDINNPSVDAPWKNNISPDVTSCANLFTTADGKDLLTEMISILCFAGETKVDISVSA